MFENYTFEELTDKMLDNVNGDFDKREGSVIYDAIAPLALELSEFYVSLDMIINEMFADTQSYYYLIKRAAEKGIYPKEETYATLKMEVIPADTPICINDRFNLEDDLNYTVTSIIDKEAGLYQVECETAGIDGNQHLGEVIAIETENELNDMESATLIEVLIPGEDEEDVEVFRERYFASFTDQAFGGNKADYKEKVNSIDGVGGCKVIRAWQDGYKPSDFMPDEAVTEWIGKQSAATVGKKVYEWLQKIYNASMQKLFTVGGTVKIYIISSEFKAPSKTLVEKIQDEIDPDLTTGEGDGVAPVGHVVKVSGVKDLKVDFDFSIVYQSGYSFDDLKETIETAIDSNFETLRESWADTDIVIRSNQIESLLLGITGITDVISTKINGKSENLILDADCIPIRGDIHG